ncbi:type II toxin-antitoxin system RelE/ParE family toxin [Hymenobacter siberiensis]|uniref:type II toxin-antitoxin system RelE/ParE family toxin n=1 Tax=Hymenobacter siberiensis TaxID=2848396 RepID=UPI0038CC133B
MLHPSLSKIRGEADGPVIARTRMLADFPQSGRMVPEFENTQLREVRSGNYRIIYRLERIDKVEIARIFHSAQLLEEL